MPMEALHSTYPNNRLTVPRMHLVDGWARRRCAPTDLLLRQDMSDRRFIPRSSVGTTIPGAVLTIYAGQRPAHPGPHPSPHTRVRIQACIPRPAHPGAVLTILLPLVFPSVRDVATTLETPFQLSAYPNNRLTVPRMHLVDGWARRRCTPTDAS